MLWFIGDWSTEVKIMGEPVIRNPEILRSLPVGSEVGQTDVAVCPGRVQIPLACLPLLLLAWKLL